MIKEAHVQKDIYDDGDIAVAIKTETESVTLMFCEDLGWQCSIMPEPTVIWGDLQKVENTEGLEFIKQFIEKIRTLTGISDL